MPSPSSNPVGNRVAGKLWSWSPTPSPPTPSPTHLLTTVLDPVIYISLPTTASCPIKFDPRDAPNIIKAFAARRASSKFCYLFGCPSRANSGSLERVLFESVARSAVSGLFLMDSWRSGKLLLAELTGRVPAALRTYACRARIYLFMCLTKVLAAPSMPTRCIDAPRLSSRVKAPRALSRPLAHRLTFIVASNACHPRKRRAAPPRDFLLIVEWSAAAGPAMVEQFLATRRARHAQHSTGLPSRIYQVSSASPVAAYAIQGAPDLPSTQNADAKPSPTSTLCISPRGCCNDASTSPMAYYLLKFYALPSVRCVAALQWNLCARQTPTPHPIVENFSSRCGASNMMLGDVSSNRRRHYTVPMSADPNTTYRRPANFDIIYRSRASAPGYTAA
ncbi:hypothetical protein DFH06DRAFT_1316860 [Mycena polygramma]|nr:hypothetical protein DFH06DRAFT_1316856 [Mycena polygramma]KAJ7678072.1 hypothetical protein DFH06DRAFT_1316860 [Mycena polygramma]